MTDIRSQPFVVGMCGKIAGMAAEIGVLRQRQLADKAVLRQFGKTAQHSMAAIEVVLQAVEVVKQPPFFLRRHIGSGCEADAVFNEIFNGVVGHGGFLAVGRNGDFMG